MTQTQSKNDPGMGQTNAETELNSHYIKASFLVSLTYKCVSSLGPGIRVNSDPVFFGVYSNQGNFPDEPISFSLKV